MMTPVDALIEARWIIPGIPRGMILEDHALAVIEGRILDILPIEEAKRRYLPQRHHLCREHALIPGLVNAHTHAAMTLLRGIADDLSLMTWLREHIWPAEQRFVGEAFVREGTLLACAEMIRSGITCFNDMYFFPEEAAQAVKEAGLRASLGLIVLDFPSPWAKTPEEYLDKGLALFEGMKARPRLRFALAPHAPYTVSDDTLKRVRELSQSLDLPVHIHLHETKEEVREHRPFARLTDLGLVNPRLQAVHMTQLEPGEIEALAASRASVIHCPESNLKLASGFCPVGKLKAAGVNVALGTDGAASNNDLDLLGEMRTAALLAKGVAEDASCLPAAEALEMATLGGARALGWEDDIGSLEVGKAADAVAIRLDHIETQPLYHPLSAIVYAADRRQVSDVWVGGRQLLREGKLTTLDPQALLWKARRWQERIAHG